MEHIVGGTNLNLSGSSSHNLTWLQRQQQKLRERKDFQLRSERYPTETRLISELRNIQQHSSTYTRVLRPPTASRRADGYTSDTTHFADDDDDFTIPLHINVATTSPTHKLNSVGSAPASPLLPNRRYYGGVNQQQSYIVSTTNGSNTLGRQRSDTSFDRERPFVAVKRAHEQSRKYNETQSPETSPQSILAAHPMGLALPQHQHHVQGSPSHQNNNNNDRSPDSTGLLTMVEEEELRRQQQSQVTATLRPKNPPGVGRSTNTNHQDALASLIASLAATSATNSNTNSTASTAWQPQMRDDSFSSWRTTSTSDEAGSPPRSTSPRPQTPAFPVHPRTPYVNNSSQQFETTGLPPKSPTTQRLALSNQSWYKRLDTKPYPWYKKSLIAWNVVFDATRSKDQSPSPVSDSNQTIQQHHVSMVTNSSTSGRATPGFQTTPHSSASLSDGFSQQQSPKSPVITNGGTGQSSPTVYYGHSRRSSLHSNSEPPQEVSPAHVKFVRDTSRFWYKPSISREEAINMLREKPPGTFVVRDSNSFPGAFGLALKVSTPPPNVQGKVSTSSDPGSELVRHFLIEPTSRGVKLKGCSNEPVFIHPTDIRTSISPSSVVELNTTSALANYATEAGILDDYYHFQHNGLSKRSASPSVEHHENLLADKQGKYEERRTYMKYSRTRVKVLAALTNERKAGDK
uniref:SH2 domain-containing protein n=1 Tax=Timema shepardi TaxID=629360 RepID=A0A7R9FY04_TIMSH|nr:unnamed protein product [Timema shepardi]